MLTLWYILLNYVTSIGLPKMTKKPVFFSCERNNVKYIRRDS